ncbi:hypothetical protein QAD02_008944 [Eretmocerus hayati]|uniref:Uncharacterized protein n=1 Tax=Eretmocerus hayati TaxID=131215 RepID=A0ACC2N895_9HYME|nr:hypothetical protein QAD02_008944 [Eretmocerus hayati]
MLGRIFDQPIHYEDLVRKIDRLSKICAGDSNEVYLSKSDKEIQLLTSVLSRHPDPKLLFENSRILITCAMRTLVKYSVYKFGVRFEVGISGHKRHTKYVQAKENFNNLVNILSSFTPDRMIEMIVTIIHRDNIWVFRRVSLDILLVMLGAGLNGFLICNKIVDKVEFPETDQEGDSKSVVKVLYELLNHYRWPENDDTTTFLERLLNLYYKSLHNSQDTSRDLSDLRGSLELCVRHIIHNVTDKHLLIIIKLMSAWSIIDPVDHNIVQKYGGTLEYAAYVHKGDTFARTLTTDIVLLLMKMIGSEVKFVSLLGNRVLQYLIDRGGNQMFFNTPKIFFPEIRLNVKLCDYNREDKSFQYNREDKHFLKSHREVVHKNMIKSILNHCHTRLNLETTYCTICLLLVEIPCGFSAAMLSCLMMHLQEIVRKHQDQIGRKESYHIHALIISVLSFVCWIHEARDFHAYVINTAMERAQWAPHLNPPLQSSYNFAVHHVHWDKPELYFDNWEVRLGLWRRFRLNQEIKMKSKRVVLIQD